MADSAQTNATGQLRTGSRLADATTAKRLGSMTHSKSGALKYPASKLQVVRVPWFAKLASSYGL